MPAWFDIAKYADAQELDAGDWLLNLLFRGWLSREQDDESEAQVRAHPVLRRASSETTEFLHMMWQRKFGRPYVVNSAAWVLEFLADEFKPRSGVVPLTVEWLYFFERSLPQALRDFASSRPWESQIFRGRDDPPEFYGRLDHAFPRQRVARFVQINLSQTDDALIEDLKKFLKSERADPRLRGPYTEAVRLASKKYAPRLKTLAKIGLLPYLDLVRCLERNGQKLSKGAIAEALAVCRDDLRKQTIPYAKLALDDLAVRAWLEPQVRGIRPKSKRR